MANENNSPTSGGDAAKGASPVRESEPKDPIPSKPATEADLAEIKTQIKKEMSRFERSTLRWTRASSIVILATAAFICLQWLEMRSGGKDTHDLAVQAKRQADKVEDMSDAADKIRKASEGMVSQEEKIADNAKNALDASNRNSRAALDATVAASRISEKAYVTIGRPDGTVAEILWPKEETGKAGLMVYFHNNGRLPAKFNWGAESQIVAILPTDPTIISYDKWKGGQTEVDTDHFFQPMYRAEHKQTQGTQFMFSGTIDIAGNSSYEGILWEVPKDRMTQYLEFEHGVHMPSGTFEYCDGFGQRICKNFTLRFATEPYNRFLLAWEDDCRAYQMQVLHPQPTYTYLPVCSISRRPELELTFPNLPKPK